MVAKVGADGSITAVEGQAQVNRRDYSALQKLEEACRKPGFHANDIMKNILVEQALVLQEMTEYARDERTAFQFKSCESRLRVLTNIWRAIEHSAFLGVLPRTKTLSSREAKTE